MKTGVFTFHFAKNYGAMLQAYALATAVRGIGHDCEVVDYRYPWMYRGEGRISLREHYALHRRRDCVAVSVLKALRRWCLGFTRRDTAQARLYLDFMQNVIPHSRRVRDWDLPDLRYDALLCGSDQVWNQRITGGVSAEYFLAFASSVPSVRRIAYAPSSGTGDFLESDWPKVVEWLSGFHAIGVRDASLAARINERVPGAHAVSVLDPTMLLPASHWESLERPVKVPGPYLLLYLVEETPETMWVYETAARIASARGLKMVKIVRPTDRVPPLRAGLEVFAVEDCGPREFLWLFHHAEYVFAGSFHASVFSILYERQFRCIPHKTCRERTDTLLGAFGLSSRNLERDEPEIAQDIDFTACRGILKTRREESLAFLENALRQS